MADVSNRSRQPQGAPDGTGGQFTAEGHSEVQVVLDTAPALKAVAAVTGYHRTEISAAAHTLRSLLSEQAAARTNSDQEFYGEGRSTAFSEYVAILHDPDVLNDPWTDVAMSQSAASARDALQGGFDVSAPSGLNETQRRAAIEYVSGRVSRELAHAAEARAHSAQARFGTQAEDHHSRGRLDGYGAALVELIHSGQPSTARLETNAKVADLADASKGAPTPEDVTAVASHQRTAHRIAAAEHEAAVAYDDVASARQELSEANRRLDRAFAADSN
ncbi:hypothetical protein ACFQBY_21890 [Promicromonospora citrea]|uniref:Uncharacterized protein n=1 Tax=Promicromonospora citrea TaxID=43677 RepID=A0A8H9GRI4_9MICO|nr:hypothetical protein [Promicromonospora citrea]NNH53284.1 hypothetical protein [Promicromonospora citrea]GGM43680.1 hypothetical protein GCM10010102_43940 [Promicromonospora citrea]